MKKLPPENIKFWNLGLRSLTIIIMLIFSVLTVMANSTENVKESIKAKSEKYYYEMDKKVQEEFFRKLKLIKIGDSIQKAKKALGNPTYDQTIASKEKGEFRARVLKYYIKIMEKNLVNEKYDRSVRLIFNEQDMLTEIESNVEGHQIRLSTNSNEQRDGEIKDGAQKYYYEMDKKAQKDFFRKLKLIKIGDSVQKVKKALGNPTYDQTIASKEKGEFRARVLDYYIKIWQKGLVNEKYDRSVQLIFNAQNKLVKIESNVEGHEIHN